MNEDDEVNESGLVGGGQAGWSARTRLHGTYKQVEVFDLNQSQRGQTGGKQEVHGWSRVSNLLQRPCSQRAVAVAMWGPSCPRTAF